MTITSTWAVVQMDAYPERNGDTDVVFNVHWTLTATDGTYTGSSYGAQGVTLDPDAPFTPYADLTQAQVIGWVKAALGDEYTAAYEANVAKQVADLANPPVITPALPWA